LSYLNAAARRRLASKRITHHLPLANFEHVAIRSLGLFSELCFGRSVFRSLSFLRFEVGFLCLEVGWNIFGFGKDPEDVSIIIFEAPVDKSFSDRNG
jgi:hypothetical protein